MSQDTVNIRILDKEYQVSCPPEERSALLQAARSLDERVRSIRNSGGVIGLERIAIMAALNLTYELSKVETQAESDGASQQAIQKLDHKVSEALQRFEKSVAF